MNNTLELTGANLQLRIDELSAQALEICRNDPHKGIVLADELILLAQSNSLTVELARGYACRGACRVWISAYDEALKDLFQALPVLQQADDRKFGGSVFYHVFCAFYFLADYDNALKYAYDMLAYAEKVQDPIAQANAMNGIGTIYYTTGENEKGVEILLKGLKVVEKLDDKHLLARILDGLGSAYFNLKDIEQSIIYKNRCLETARSISLKQVESYAIDGLAKIYLSINDLKNTEKHFRESLALREELDFKAGICETNLQLGELYIKKQEWEKALTHLEKALRLSTEINAKEVIYKSHEALSRYYEKQQDTSLFVAHFKQYFHYKEEFFSEKNKQKMKSAEMQFRITRMEEEKELLSSKNKELEALSNDLKLLSDLGKKITSELSVESINKTAYEIINSIMDAPGFGIGVIKENGSELVFPGYIEDGKVLESSADDLSDENRMASLCFNREIDIVINDFEAEAGKYIKKIMEPVVGESVNSLIYLPLKVNDRKIGVITVQSFNKNAYTEYHVNLVKNLALYCGIAIENATMYERMEEQVAERTKQVVKQKEEIQRSHENTHLLGIIGQQIISSTDFDSIFKSLHSSVSKLMNADCFGVRIYDENRQEIEYRYEMERGERLLPLTVSMSNEDNFSVWCVKNRKEIFINDNQNEYHKYTKKIVVPSGDMPHSLLFCPMAIGERIVGVITVQSFEKNVYVPLHIDILKTLGTYTAIALENANLVENLEVKVKERTSEVVKQKEVIEEKNKHITDSIKYAKRIQEAIIPGEDMVKAMLKNSFVLYKPKDIVSGDFYWIERKGNKILFAVVDCTGHGVPGAFMSIIGFNGLNQIVNELNHIRPADILTRLNKSITHTLRQRVEDSVIRDGMDMAICCIDLDTNKLEFAGAFNPLFIIRDNEVVEIKGDKQPIGNFLGQENYEFTNKEIDLLPNDKLYLFSDGFADQFGGPNGKKLKYNYFRKLLLDNHAKPMEEQKVSIDRFFENWREGFEQIDDVCIIGVGI
ncbi:MAG TPA: GAF domain-containing protein [Bacteroidia bacterium]|jgi:serine phosphatase RsbU (regulator of sigma subunit)/tetratricopeptide (TPR) repeat protein